LIVNGRVRPTADYLVASKLRSEGSRRRLPRFHARFPVAGGWGRSKSAELQWWAVAKSQRWQASRLIGDETSSTLVEIS